MTPLDWLYQARAKLRIMSGHKEMAAFDMPSQELDPSKGGELLAVATNDLEKIFYTHKGRVVHKWIHYPAIYDRFLSVYRNTPVKMLEIGVFKGGSLEMWRTYLGAQATIFGIDINPDCAEYVDPPNQVRIGSQADPKFLRGVIDEMGAPDIILDDGSHVASHQRASFFALFPLLAEGGLYMIEDLHTSYWRGAFEGGLRRPGTAIELVKTMIDDMHAWYHGRRQQTAGKTQIGAIHIFDSIVVIEKARRTEPLQIKVGPAAGP